MPKHRNRLPTIGMPGESADKIVDRVVRWLAQKYKEQSPAETLAAMCREDRVAWLNSLSEEELRILEYTWGFWARPKQRIPEVGWKNCLLLGGRGAGKTRCAAEWVRSKVESGKYKYIALVGPTAGDLRKVMIEDIRGAGSGLLQVCPPWNFPHYSRVIRRVTWENPNYPSYGACCSLYSGDEPDLLRGPAHDAAWIDELMRMREQVAVWDMLQMGLRIGTNPQAMISTTPKPTPLMLKLLKMPNTLVITSSTFENRSSLSAEFLKTILEEYEGTRLGRQELYAEVLSDVEGALWTLPLIEAAYLPKNAALPILRTRVVGVDPQMSATGPSKNIFKAPLTGIIVAGASIANQGNPVNGYVLADRSMSGTPKQWGTAVVEAYWDYECHMVVAERNQGGELVADNIHNIDPNVRIKLVTASKSKGERAIPVVSRYEQGRIFHLGNFPALETEMVTFVPGDEKKKKSPNRVDALVHALDFLLVGGARSGAGIAIGRRI